MHLTQVALAGGKLGRADLERISRWQTLDISLGQLENPFFMRAGQVLGCNIFSFSGLSDQAISWPGGFNGRQALEIRDPTPANSDPLSSSQI